MSPWRRILMEQLCAMTDAELKEAMLEVSAGQQTIGGHLWQLASKIAEPMQTKPEHAVSVVSKAVVTTAAYRFAGLVPESKNLC